MAANIKQYIEQALATLNLKEGCKLVLAYSGGVDSESLAHGLSLFAESHSEFQYLLLHVHHGLSQNADSWIEHCTERANIYHLPLKVCRVKVAQGPRLSVEAEARKSRYAAIIDNMSAGDVLLTAHHEDDQLETLLLAIKRGQGPKGLACMGEVQSFDKDKCIVRPILSLSRVQIEEYAAHFGFSHVEDESNHDNHYDRNFLRNVVIPQLKSRWPSFASTASRSASLCAEQQLALNEEVSSRLATMVLSASYGNQLGLDIDKLSKQSKPWQRLLLRGFIELQHLPMPSQVQLKEILNQLCQSRADAKVELQFASLLIRRFQHTCYAFDYHHEQQIQESIKASIPIEIEIESLKSKGAQQILKMGVNDIAFDSSKDGIRVTMSASKEKITLGYAHHFNLSSSHKCHPHFRSKKRELKKIWQELAIPFWLRQRVPLVFYGDHLVAAIGLWIESDYLAKENELGISFKNLTVK